MISVLAPRSTIAQTAGAKAARGLAAMSCAFLEIPGNMLVESRKWGTGGLFLGFFKGAGKTVPRFWIGAYEFFSCPIEAPVDFIPIIQPEYPWGYFDETSCKMEDSTTKGKEDPESIYWDY